MTAPRFYGPLSSSFRDRVQADSITTALACMRLRSPFRGMSEVCALLDIPVVHDV